MIIFEGKRDLFKSKKQTLVCPVNVVGVMGRGLALAFRQKWPHSFDFYRALYRNGSSPWGGVDNVDPYDQDIHALHTAPLDAKRQVLYFPTKKHWKRPSRLEWIEINLQRLAKDYAALGIESLAIPPVGCGNGQLNYRDVQPLIYEHLDPLPIPVELVY